MNNLRKTLLAMLLLIVGIPHMMGQASMFFNSNGGLPNSLVNCIEEDSYGRIWIATEDGLCMFNGSRFITFRNEKNNECSLASNFVRTLCADDKGHVLVGTTAGLQIHNPFKRELSRLIEDRSLGIRRSNINAIAPLSDGGFVVAGQDVFSVYIAKDGTAEVRKNSMTQNVHNVLNLTQSKDGSIWATCQPGGVYKTMGKDGKVVHITDAAGKNYSFSVLYEAPDGNMYAGHSDSGVYVYDAKLKHFKLVPGTETVMQVRDLCILKDKHTLCIGTDGSGVMLYDLHTKKMVSNEFFHNPFINILSQKVHDIHVSHDGGIWLSLYQKGIFLTSSEPQIFEYIGERSRHRNLIGGCCVTSMVQTYDNNIWVTTDNGGLYGFTTDYQQIHSFVPNGSSESVPSNMLGLFEDSRHRMWFGSFQHGCGTVNLSTGHCSYKRLNGVDGMFYSVYDFAEDKRGQIWGASMGNGIVRYDEQTQTFSTYLQNPGTAWSTCLMYDAQSDIFYVGSYGNASWFSPSDPKKTIHNIGNYTVVFAITRVSANEIAFCTTDGLVLYDTKKKSVIKTITTENGLPNNAVLAAEMGKDGYLWLSSTEGLTRYDLKNMASQSFTVRDGLQGNEFYKNASMAGRDGRLWFGGINGITAFNPKRIDNLRKTGIKAKIASIRADEQYVLPNEDGEYIMPHSIAAITLELAASPFYMTHRITYSYQIDNDPWEVLHAPQNTFTYSNIGYGEHVLLLKTVIDGKESEVTRTIIYVPYPWYLKWWVVCLWMLMLLSLAYWIFTIYNHRRELKKAVLEHQREEELKETKLQFFMNIVHDLRTPLTLIATPLQKLLSMGDDSTHQRLYTIMNKNAYRLMRLSDEIMDLRKIDRGKMVLRCHESYISQFIVSLVDNMTDMAETRKLSLQTVDHTDGKQKLWYDMESLEKVLINLISNALKFTESGGYIRVEWGIDAEHLCIKVTDNGIGIPESEKIHIFDRFYQSMQGEKYIKGTGIGLNLVKSLVELHHGEISVQDNPECHGTQFVVLLPSQKSAYSSDELISSPAPELMPVEDGGQQNEILEDAMAKVVLPDVETPDEVAVKQNEKPSKRKTLLIADDDDDILQFLFEEMSVNFNVLTASDGQEAYDILLHSNVDLIISDVMMPNIDGIKLCKMVRSNIRFNNVPFILLTAKNSDQYHIEGLQAKADAYITKPFNLQLLQTMVTNLLLRTDNMRNTIKGFEMSAEKVDTPDSVSADERLMERLVKVINANLNNPNLTSDLLAREVGLSRVHLYRKLKELTNMSATSYIRNIRLTKAAELLRDKHLTVSETAYLVGFRTPNHFSTAFKELYGISPKEYSANSEK